jgi:hypothetical protein
MAVAAGLPGSRHQALDLGSRQDERGYMHGQHDKIRAEVEKLRRELAETTSKLQERLARLPLVKTWTDMVHYVGDVVVDGDGGGAVATCCARSSVSISGIQLDHAFAGDGVKGFCECCLALLNNAMVPAISPSSRREGEDGGRG